MAYVSGRYHLSNLLMDVYARLGSITFYSASGGSTTTAINTGTNITDTNLSGALFVKETTDNAAPEGEFSTLSSFAPGTGTFTVGTTLGASVGSGDIFGYATPLYPLQQLIELANMGLSSIGKLVLVDTTILTGVSNQSEYAVSVAWKNKVTRVDIQGITSDSDDNKWIKYDNWEYIPAAAGSTGLIVFNSYIPVGHDLRIWYTAKHPRVNSYDDFINEAIDPELAIAATVAQAVEWQLSRTQGNNSFLIQKLNDARDQFRVALGEFKLRQKNKIKHFNLGSTAYYDNSGPGLVTLA